MTDLLGQGAAWLEGMRHRHMTRPVVYQRGALAVTIQATVGRTVFEVSNAQGVVTQVERRDFLVRAQDLVLGSTVVLPAPGDRIRETRGEKVHVYEVMGAGNEKHFRPSDPDGLTLRIHTAEVAEEPEL
jgi:hypothetical protein